MDKELQNKLADKVFEYLKNTEQFLIQKAPDFISEYLNFIMIDTISNIVVTSLIIAISIVAIFIFNKFTSKSNLKFFDYNDENRITTKMVSITIPVIIMIGNFAYLIYYITFLIQLYFAPKVAMIYYLSQMINN